MAKLPFQKEDFLLELSQLLYNDLMVTLSSWFGSDRVHMLLDYDKYPTYDRYGLRTKRSINSDIYVQAL